MQRGGCLSSQSGKLRHLIVSQLLPSALRHCRTRGSPPPSQGKCDILFLDSHIQPFPAFSTFSHPGLASDFCPKHVSDCDSLVPREWKAPQTRLLSHGCNPESVNLEWEKYFIFTDLYWNLASLSCMWTSHSSFGNTCYFVQTNVKSFRIPLQFLHMHQNILFTITFWEKYHLHSSCFKIAAIFRLHSGCHLMH